MCVIKRESKGNQLHLTFVLPKDQPSGAVSVVGDFNEWRPGTHTLVRRSNGTRSVKVAVTAGEKYRFRYLGEDGNWFDDPNVDVRDGQDGVVLA
jgi:hypothetical protein